MRAIAAMGAAALLATGGATAATADDIPPPAWSGEAAERAAVLRDAGFTDAQIEVLLTDPASVTTWRTEVVTSDDVRVVDAPVPGAIDLGDGTYAVGDDQPDALGTRCSWAITRHDGSAFAQRMARLNLRTDWCWNGSRVVGTPTTQHSTSVTLAGGASGWRVDPSQDGSNGRVGRNYRTEAKANWKLEACLPAVCRVVQSGTAFARHLVKGDGTVAKEQGGWP